MHLPTLSTTRPFSRVLPIVMGGLTLMSTLIKPTIAQSQVPSCYVCPTVDLADFELTNSDFGPTPFSCEYGDAQWFCTYNPVTGELVVDNNEGLCLPEATSSCAERREIMRRNALPHAPAPPSPAAREIKPGVMHTRARLGHQKKRIQRGDN